MLKTKKMKKTESLFIDREYIDDIERYVKKGKRKIGDDKYKYSTKNIIIPNHFNIEEIFINDGDGKTKLP